MSSVYFESELVVLLGYEGKLVAALKKEDVMSLYQRLYERVVISKEVKDKFASLDHDNLKTELMVRYLLQHVYDAVKHKNLVLYSFVEVLGEFDKGVAGELRRELRKYELLEVVGQSRTSIGDISLCEEDVPELTELLSSGSYKSEELGLSLGLHKNQLIQCHKGCSNMIALSNVLLEWIRCSKEPCTVNRLKEALSSNTVALNNMASQLGKKFLDAIKGHVTKTRHVNRKLQAIYCSDDTTVAYGKSTLLGFLTTSTNPVRRQWRKYGQPLADNKVYSGTHSAFLFVSCVGVQIEGKYDCLIYSDSGFSAELFGYSESGSSELIGYSESGSSELIGYSESGSSELMRCGKINLTMSHSEISRQFLKIYSKMDEIPKDSWPPVTNTEFINLALITRNKQTNDDYDYAVQGDMDDIIAAKENVSYEKVFVKYESGTLLLVEGRPGSGKTTLMHKVTRDWAIKRNVLFEAEIVVLVPLRLFFGKDVTLSSILEKYIESYNDRIEYIESAKRKNGEGICFIIDGLDEYELNNDRSTFVYELIHKHVLSFAMVIVASRPVGTASVRNEASVYKRIEVLGFKNEQIMKYVKSYYNDSIDIGSGLIKYLKSHINVLRMCYLPVHAAMICFLYGKRRDNIPQTETRIYETFTILTLLRKLKRENKRHESISSLHCLTGDIKKYFNKICELAFDMTIHSKQAILQSQTQFPLSTPGSDKSSLGLVTIDSNAELFGMEDLYSFLHLTFQEYLAAFYLAGLEDDREIICKTKERHNNLQMVWKFYCGMVQFKAHSLVLNYIMSDTDLDMYKIHYAFESQQHIVCDSVLELDKADTLSFKDHSLIPTDFLAISYVISTSSDIVTTLTFTDCSLDGEGVALFLEKMSGDHLENIKYLGYHNGKCTVAQLWTINLLLRRLTDLEVLDLEKTELCVDDVRTLTGYEITELPNLRTLKIELPLNLILSDSVKVLKMLKFRSTKFVLIQYACPKENSSIENDYFIFMLMKAFSNLIWYNSTYQTICCYNGTFQSFPQTSMEYIQSCSKLVLINCGITDDDLKLLVESMSIFTELRTLRLDFNRITGKGATLLSSLLKKVKCTSLEVVSAQCNQIDDSGALAIAKALVRMSNLKILDLQGNPITDNGASALIKTVKDLRKDFQVYVTISNSLLNKSNLRFVKESLDLLYKGHDKSSLCTALKCCTNLQTLDLSDNSIGSDGAVVLAERLKCGTNLQYNCIGSDGAVALAEGLKCCTNLHTLNLSYNSIGSDGGMALAEGLKCCTNLQTLYLSYNSIGSNGGVALAEGLKCCTNLQTLCLSYNNIGSDGAVALAEGLKCCTNLHTLNLSYNSIGSDGGMALAEGLKCCTNLQTLYLSYNSIGSNGGVTLAEGLKCCTNLQTLDLSDNSVGFYSAVALAEGLQCCTNLQTLDLSDNSIGSNGAVALAEGLKCCTNLQTLDLNYNSIGSYGAVALAEGLKCCTNLQTLDLSSNSIGSDGAVTLTEGLKYCTNLQTLNLGYNSIDLDGGVALAEGLKCCTNLQTLYLSYNSIGSDGGVALAEGLKCCTNLQTLCLSYNNIGSDGAVALAEGLKCCTNLQTLYLSYNSIGSDGGVALAEGLKCCTNLQTLCLSYNNIGSDGAVALAEGLKCCTNLQTLYLSYNSIGSDGAVALAEGLKCCTNLQRLYLSYNSFGSDGAVAVAVGTEVLR